MEKSKVFQNAALRTPRYGGYLKIKEELSADIEPISQSRRQLIDSKNTSYLPVVSDDWNLSKEDQDVLASVVGCVMQMAAKKRTISSKQLEVVETYLKSAKENNTEVLPNVNGILKYMSSLRDTPKPPNQNGDYTYAYKHSNDVYCALDSTKNLNKMNIFENKKSRRHSSNERRSKYISELEMSLRNSYRRMQ